MRPHEDQPGGAKDQPLLTPLWQTADQLAAAGAVAGEDSVHVVSHGVVSADGDGLRPTGDGRLHATEEPAPPDVPG